MKQECFEWDEDKEKINGDFIMIKRIARADLKPLTEEKKRQLHELKNNPLTFDEDCPELTDEIIEKLMASKLKRAL